MIDTYQIYEELKATFGADSVGTLVRILGKIYEDIKNTVTRQDFSELQKVVEELAEAQKRTELRIDILTERVEGISNTFGYALENIAYKHLPDISQGKGNKILLVLRV